MIRGWMISWTTRIRSGGLSGGGGAEGLGGRDEREGALVGRDDPRVDDLLDDEDPLGVVVEVGERGEALQVLDVPVEVAREIEVALRLEEDGAPVDAWV